MFTLFKKAKSLRHFEQSEKQMLFSCKCTDIGDYIPCDEYEKKSPFSIYEGEIYCEVFPKIVTSSKKASFLISKNYITSVETEIFIILNSLIYATSKQIADYLTIGGFDITKEAVSKRLSRLKENGFIRQLQFKTENGISSFKIYTLGKHGRFYLINRGVYVRKTIFLPAFKIKKILSATQLALQIAMHKKVNFRISDILKVHINEDENQTISLRPHALISNDTECAMVEVVRKNTDWQSAFLEKLERYRFFIENQDCLCTRFNATPHLIVLCEDFNHIKDTHKIIPPEYIKAINLVFTFDRALIDNVDDSFFTFK